MWTLIFVIILSFIFLLVGFIVLAAVSFGNYFITKKDEAQGEEKGKTASTTKP